MYRSAKIALDGKRGDFVVSSDFVPISGALLGLSGALMDWIYPAAHIHTLLLNDAIASTRRRGCRASKVRPTEAQMNKSLFGFAGGQPFSTEKEPLS